MLVPVHSVERWGNEPMLTFTCMLPGSGFPLEEGALACTAHVHFPGSAPGLTEAAIGAAVAGVSPGFGRMRTVCAALSSLAKGHGASALAKGVVPGACSGCTSEAGMYAKTQPHVCSKPPFSLATPKHACLCCCGLPDAFATSSMAQK